MKKDSSVPDDLKSQTLSIPDSLLFEPWWKESSTLLQSRNSDYVVKI